MGLQGRGLLPVALGLIRRFGDGIGARRANNKVAPADSRRSSPRRENNNERCIESARCCQLSMSACVCPMYPDNDHPNANPVRLSPTTLQ
jgi:hypothetical protein